jgi:hypothetical protein
MNEPHNDSLLHDLLQDGAGAAFREASLNTMLSAARRTRRQRKTLRLAGCAAVLLLGATAIWQRPNIPTAPTAIASHNSPVAADPARKPIRYIDDKELLSLFPNRPVALIGSAQGQQLILLDREK